MKTCSNCKHYPVLSHNEPCSSCVRHHNHEAQTVPVVVDVFRQLGEIFNPKQQEVKR